MRLSLAEAKRRGLIPDGSGLNGASAKPVSSPPGVGAGKPRRVNRMIQPADNRPQPSREICFTVPAAAVPKERARTVRSGTQTYTPRRTRHFAKLVAEFARPAMTGFSPFAGPVAVDVLFIVAVPKSWKEIHREQALRGEILPTGRPDLDNLVKNILDALNKGVVFRDDAQICSKRVDKIYGKVAEVQLKFRAMPGRGVDQIKPKSSEVACGKST